MLNSSPTLLDYQGFSERKQLERLELLAFNSRLHSCSKKFFKMSCLDCNAQIVVSQMCKSRFCLDCAPLYASRSRKVLQKLLLENHDLLKSKKMRFTTLTCPNYSFNELLGGFNQLSGWFAKLLRRKITRKQVNSALYDIKHNMTLQFKIVKMFGYDYDIKFYKFVGLSLRDVFKGGIKRFEVTKNETTKEINLHIHCLHYGRFLPKPLLAAVWSDILSSEINLSTSATVDMRKMDGSYNSLLEICKYAFKPAAFSFEERCLLDQIFKGRRLYSYVGDWHKRSVELHESQDAEARNTCPCCSGTNLKPHGRARFGVHFDNSWLSDEGRFYKPPIDWGDF